MAAAPDPIATRELIVTAAATCLRARGGRRVSIADIARTAGVSRGTVYAHFGNKDEVVAAVAEAASSNFYGTLVEVIDREARFEDKMSSLAVFLVDTMRSGDPDVALDDDEISLLLTLNAARLMADCVEFLLPYLAQARRRGEVRADLDLGAAAEWFARILFSLASTPTSTLDLDDREVVRRFVSDHVVRGFGPPGEPAPSSQ